MINLRPYQQHAVVAVRDAYRNGRRAPLLVLPTGGGKTIIFSHIAATTAARGKRAIILVHRIELLRQTYEKLTWAGVRTGLVNPKYTPDITAPVQVASVQTLGRRLEFLRVFNPDLIVIDEAHHATAGTWRTCIQQVPNARVLGVTATPCRGDGKGLGLHVGGLFDELVEGPTVKELIDMQFLVRPVVYAPTQRLDLSGIKIKMGDYDKHEIEIAVDKPTITGDAVAHYRRLCSGAPAVVFCISVRHAEHVAAEFRAAGYRAYAVDGSMDDDQRKRILAGLGTGLVQVVCSCDLISEGTDIPAVACAILLRPTQSLGLYLQQVGRALRPSEGKPHAVILDHVGNCLTHGMPDDDREWSLDGAVRKKKKGDKEPTIPVRQCPACYAMHHPAITCPACGHVYEIDQRQVKQVEGELQQVTPEQAARIAKEKRRQVGSAKSLEQLLAIERERGYKSGWAEHVYRARNARHAPV